MYPLHHTSLGTLQLNVGVTVFVHHNKSIFGAGAFGHALSYCHVIVLLAVLLFPQLSVTTHAGIVTVLVQYVHAVLVLVAVHLYKLVDTLVNHHNVQFVIVISHCANPLTASFHCHVTVHAVHHVLHATAFHVNIVMYGAVVSVVTVVLTALHQFHNTSLYLTYIV
jgi:hypothetical protein